MADPVLILTILIIVVALAFDYVNGFHDAANSIATVVSTRVLTPLQGVAWAAFWNFIAAFTFGTAVAKTIGSGLLDVKQVDSFVILAGLLGAIVWDLITWYVGLPTSSSHALIGGYAGAASPRQGSGSSSGGWIRTLDLHRRRAAAGNGTRHAQSDRDPEYLQTLHSSQRRPPLQARAADLGGAYSLGHGTNDAQKTMGIIAGALFIVPEYRYLVSDDSRQTDHPVLDRA